MLSIAVSLKLCVFKMFFVNRIIVLVSILVIKARPRSTFASIYTVQKRCGTSSKAFIPASSYTPREFGCFLNLNNVPAYLNMRTQNITYNRF